MNIRNNEKTIVYSNDEHYVECSCVVKEDSINIFRNIMRDSKASCTLLHTFENILKDDVISLEKVIAAVKEGEDIEKTANLTKHFLDLFEVNNQKVEPLDDFSARFSHAQKGTFGLDNESKKTLKKYESLSYNNKVMKTIGYELKAQPKNKKTACHRKILAIAK